MDGGIIVSKSKGRRGLSKLTIATVLITLSIGAFTAFIVSRIDKPNSAPQTSISLPNESVLGITTTQLPTQPPIPSPSTTPSSVKNVYTRTCNFNIKRGQPETTTCSTVVQENIESVSIISKLKNTSRFSNNTKEFQSYISDDGTILYSRSCTVPSQSNKECVQPYTTTDITNLRGNLNEAYRDTVSTIYIQNGVYKIKQYFIAL